MGKKEHISSTTVSTNIKASSRLKQRPRNGPSKEYVKPSKKLSKMRRVDWAWHKELWWRAQISCGASLRQEEDKDVTMSYLLPNCNSFPLEDYVWLVSAGRKHCSWWCAICGETYDLRAPKRFLVVQTGDPASQGKVFKAHAVPHYVGTWSMRSNYWPTSKNIETVQSFVAKLCARSREGIMEGLRHYWSS